MSDVDVRLRRIKQIIDTAGEGLSVRELVNELDWLFNSDSIAQKLCVLLEQREALRIRAEAAEDLCTRVQARLKG